MEGTGLEFSLCIADNALVVFVTLLTEDKLLDPFRAIVFTNIRSGAVDILEFLWAYIGETYLGTFWALLAFTILYSLIPRVVVAALKKSRVCCNYQEDGEYLVYVGDRENSAGTEQPTVESVRGPRRFLDGAALYNPSTIEEDLRTEVKKWRLCTMQQVAETKDCMSMTPLCITFLMLGIFIAIGDSYFIDEANGLDNHVGPIHLPIQVLFKIASIRRMISENVCSFMCTKYAIEDQPPKRFQGACRIGLGIFMSIVCSGFSAFVVARKKRIKWKYNPFGKDTTLPMSVFWLVPQMFMLEVVEGLAVDGIESFFDHELPGSMRRCPALFTKVIIGVGVTLSAALSCLALLLGSRLYDSIDRFSVSPSRNFYVTLAVISSLNLVIYVFVARRWISKRTHGSEEGTNATRPFHAETVNS
ncbi:hypothetical protein Ancab_013945 [Ancistrocladus abbreviatus]